MKILKSSRNVVIARMFQLREELKNFGKLTNQHYLLRLELTRLSNQLLSVDLNNLTY